MQAKVELNRIRDTGKVIDDSIQFIKQNRRELVRSYFTICGIFWLTGLIVSTYQQLNYFDRLGQGMSMFGWLYFVTIILQLLGQVLMFVFTYSFMAVYKDKGNVAPSVVEVWGYTKYYFLRAAGSSLLLAIMIMIGFVLCFVPGIYLTGVFSLVFPIMIFENGGFGYSFNRAFKLIKERWWSTFGVIFLSTLLMYVALILVGIPATIISYIYIFVSGAASYKAYMITYSIATHLAQILYLLPCIAIGIMYFNLTEQKEDTHILQRIANLGKDDESDSPAEPLHKEEY
ncbi:hypothetical protein [Mucilaginibacter myungsuensis]|uniref:Glycerophosphoryl diester phosphodiesterase membrane domain-containing protein n=1 Tax=Mucilaginibacter myungsuensis TaxID=649104 RepID=A0A929KSH1_9SPHI|nr:hypothetical protein [Mucilaginibacter myungsuensis]MBE9660684.1 hypothetical protein [Mucilaginibacter myungsuensis]MDN3600729.1 hypothetical protein [Mucilaginibacter myungsuensis]